MPYIKKEDRRRLIDFKHYSTFTPNIWEMRGAGELNYMISALVEVYMSQHGKSYQTMNDIMGAMEGAKMELYRRVVVPYENGKIIDNGDIYDFAKSSDDGNVDIGLSSRD